MKSTKLLRLIWRLRLYENAGAHRPAILSLECCPESQSPIRRGPWKCVWVD